MDRLKVLQLARKILKLRKDKYKLEKEEKAIRNELLQEMDNKLVLNLEGIIIQQKIRTMKTLKPGNNLSDDLFNFKDINTLIIKEEQHMELVNGKFIICDKE